MSRVSRLVSSHHRPPSTTHSAQECLSKFKTHRMTATQPQVVEDAILAERVADAEAEAASAETQACLSSARARRAEAEAKLALDEFRSMLAPTLTKKKQDKKTKRATTQLLPGDSSASPANSIKTRAMINKELEDVKPVAKRTRKSI